jgi:hypothetical protein
MSHYSRFTDPGWQRVGTSSSAPGLLASAWMNPEHDTLTLILVNASAGSMSVGLDLETENVRSARLTRTVFDGSERFADLGTWLVGSSISLPRRSIVTVVINE